MTNLLYLTSTHISASNASRSQNGSTMVIRHQVATIAGSRAQTLCRGALIAMRSITCTLVNKTNALSVYLATAQKESQT